MRKTNQSRRQSAIERFKKGIPQATLLLSRVIKDGKAVLNFSYDMFSLALRGLYAGRYDTRSSFPGPPWILKKLKIIHNQKLSKLPMATNQAAGNIKANPEKSNS